ncbi:MAG: sirohydrochlorin cobaltochelatase [Spirochaetota bacterium]|nr:sirohydrochlorin cobaltochelatase [Spirochaetota bacterium]
MIESGGAKKMMNKKGILVVSFGTSYAKTRRLTIDVCENRIAKAFPDYELRRAFTSNIIIKKLKERDNIFIDKVDEALWRMKSEGFTDVIVQPLHIIPGEEYNDKVISMAEKFNGEFKRLVVGKPLLFESEDFMDVIKSIEKQVPKLRPAEAVLFMGHGSHHPGNSVYMQLQNMIDEKNLPVYIATVEGSPLLDEIIPRLKRDDIEKLTLMPFMLVAGDHAINDMAGDEEDSWKNILEKEGFRVDLFLHGLGENPLIQDIFVRHTGDAISGKLRN